MKLDFLKQFIKQIKTDSLKTKDYPKEFLDLKMKVFFVKGDLTRVPRGALRAPDMRVIEDFFKKINNESSDVPRNLVIK